MFFSLLHNQKKRYNGKRILSAITAAALVLAMPVVESGGFAGFWGEIAAYAKTAQELKEEAEQNLNDTNNKIDEIEGQQQEVQNKLDQAADQLTELLAKQDKLKAQITETQKQVAQANKDLDEAIQKEAEE